MHNQTSGQSYSPVMVSNTEVTFDLTTVSLQPQDGIVCSITATDAHGGISTDSLIAMVENLPPVFDSNPQISPSSSVLTGTTVTCSALRVQTQKMETSNPPTHGRLRAIPLQPEIPHR